MLDVITNFLSTHGVKSTAQLATPKIVRQDRMSWVRNSVLHYLEIDTASKFPNRNMYQLRNVEENKKIPITHIHEMRYKDGTGTLKDKYIDNQINKWKNSHIKSFKNTDIIEKPVTDVQTIAVINHNPYKNVYAYVSDKLAFFQEHHNYLRTYADITIEYVKALPNQVHMIRMDIPSIIPGYKLMNRFLELSDTRMSTVVDDPDVYWFFEWFKWFNSKLRKQSAFAELTDQDAKSVIIEFRSKGYSCFVPLAVLRGLSEESHLPSTIKMNDTKASKAFILFCIRLQDAISELNDNFIAKQEFKDDSDPEGYKDDDSSYEGEDDSEDDDDAPDAIKTKKLEDEQLEALSPLNSIKTSLGETGSDKDEIYVGVIGDDLFSMVDDFDDLSSELYELGNEETPVNAKGKKKTIAYKEIPTPEQEEQEKEEEEQIEESPVHDPIEEAGLTEEALTVDEEMELLDGNSLDELIDQHIKRNSDINAITSSDIRSIRKSQEKRSRLKDPYNKKVTANETINKEVELYKLTESYGKVKINNDLVPESYRTDKIKAFDKQYIDLLLEKDIVRAVTDIEKSGIIITDYEVEKVRNSVDSYEYHRISVRPLRGKPNTIHFKIPSVDSHGSFMANGIKYRLRKTKQDLPIRKISETEVALTSNYGKFFVIRSPRAAYNRQLKIDKIIRKDYLDGKPNIKKIIPGVKKLNHLKDISNDYITVASNFDQIETPAITFMFSDDLRDKVLDNATIEKMKGMEDRVKFVGVLKKTQEPLIINKENMVGKFSTGESLGSLMELLGIEERKLPKSFTSVKHMGKEIPLVIVMSYYIGLSNLIRLMKVKFTVTKPNATLRTMNPNMFPVRFKDCKVWLDLDTEEKSILFHGFLYFKDFIAKQRLAAFDNKNIYLNLLEERKMGVYYLRELDNLDRMFLDSMTVEVLEAMKEPTMFRKLLLRANNMLADFYHKDVNDPELSRVRGYDRFAGLIYRELAKSARDMALTNDKNAVLGHDPYKIWNTITQDNTIKTRDIVNPIASLKENEIITIAGIDGLSTDAVPVGLRRFHKNETGLISEATIDSKNVAIASYLAPYMNVENSRGIVSTDRSEIEADPSKMFSTAVQLAPFAEYDDQQWVLITSNCYAESFLIAGSPLES